MSRSHHWLLCQAWWGDWHRFFYVENKRMRERGRRKRRRQDDREWRREFQRGDGQ